MDKKSVLIVDDDPDILKLLEGFLLKYAFAVKTADSGKAALAAIKDERFDIIILDLVLPDIFGADLCKSIRRLTTTPILLLTASTEEQDYIIGLESGADDYIQKTTGLPVILAKIKAILRKEDKQATKGSNIVASFKLATFSGWRFKPSEAKLTSPDKTSIFLTESEVNVLILLLEHSSETIARDIIGRRLGIVSKDPFYRAVDIIISRLRNKMKKIYSKCNLIKTVRNKGYQLKSGVDYD